MEINFLNSRSIIVLICILQGMVFAGLLFRRSLHEKARADFWLAILLTVLSASLITPLIGYAHVYNNYQWLTYFPFSIMYASGVCIWLYVLNLTDSGRGFRRKDWLLFTPSAIYLLFRLYLFAQNLEFKDWFDDNYYVPLVSPVIAVTSFIWNLIFLYLSIIHYHKYRQWLDANYSDTEKIKFDWLRNFLHLFSFIFILNGVFDFIGNFLFRLSYVQYFYFEAILAAVIYYLAIAGYLRSRSIEINFSETESLQTERAEEKRPLIPEKELKALKDKLQNLMESEKPFLDPQLTLSELSKKLGVNTAVLSYVINSGFDKNFNDFINEFRVSKVKTILQNGGAKNSNLLDIAFNCGFNSKTTFNRVFKKMTGVSPKGFQDNRSA